LGLVHFRAGQCANAGLQLRQQRSKKNSSELPSCVREGRSNSFHCTEERRKKGERDLCQKKPMGKGVTESGGIGLEKNAFRACPNTGKSILTEKSLTTARNSRQEKLGERFAKRSVFTIWKTGQVMDEAIIKTFGASPHLPLAKHTFVHWGKFESREGKG